MKFKKEIELNNDELNWGYMPLTESNLKRVVNGHDNSGYVIISACRDNLYKTPDGEVYSVYPDANGNFVKRNEEDIELIIGSQQHVDENNKRTKKLRDELYKNNLSFIPVYGGLREEGQPKAKIEKFFIIYPFDSKFKNYKDFDEFANLMLEMGLDYTQDSILIEYPNKNPVYYDCRTKKPDSYEFKSAKLNDITQEYFTALKKWSDSSLKDAGSFNGGSKLQRFTLESLFMNSFPKTINEHHRRRMQGELVRFEE